MARKTIYSKMLWDPDVGAKRRWSGTLSDLADLVALARREGETRLAKEADDWYLRLFAANSASLLD